MPLGVHSQLVNVSRYDKRIMIRIAELDRTTSGRGIGRTSKSGVHDRVIYANVIQIATQTASKETEIDGVLSEPQTGLTVFCHWSSRPNEKDEIIYLGKVYRIIGIAEIGRKQEARIECEILEHQ